MTFIITLNAFSLAAMGEPLPPQSELIQQAVFAEDHRVSLPGKIDQINLGVASLNSGWGLIYTRNISQARKLWVQASYTPNNYIFLDDFKETPQLAYAEVHETKRLQLIAGVDQIISLTSNKYWGFVVGLGAGLNQSDYYSKFYPQKCNWFYCGYDPNSPTEKRESFLYAMALVRFGVVWREISVFGNRGDIFVGGHAPFARWPEPHELTTPDGRQLSPSSTSRAEPLRVEATVEI